jgi:Flp pilus assembly protein TadG
MIRLVASRADAGRLVNHRDPWVSRRDIPVRAFTKLLRQMRSRSGSAAIEFAIIAPILFYFLFGLIETGFIFFLDTTLQNATDDAGRLVRTGRAQGQSMTQAQFAAQICGEMTGAISLATCEANLQIDMRAYSNFSTVNYQSDTNSNGSINTNNMEYQTGTACNVVIVRAYYPWSVMTPLMKPLLANMPNGQFLLTSASAFRIEPYLSGQTC